ncbi:hypothetical protein G3495_21450 [Shewanella baltica]|uniref:hypothetical protein n=1 Tax=Shewanella baltica TaxID=62322 RepID=UPI00217CE7E5|nr:hypothetical protein [Shewanella baltica]MCS6237653.1 hypothetical protein [Shewanella baltica]MCS6261411.1 hypothetical protein [Shewanella baltica]MCS6272218.1 hypothetical protein [Shewanella baltica]
MKIRAYVLNNLTNKYLVDENGRLLEVYAEMAAAIKKNYPHEHAQREYRDIRANPELRRKLKIVKKSNKDYYSYIGNNSSLECEHVDESESHRAVINALSRLKTMNFHIKDSNLPLKPFVFTEVLVEPKIELPNGKTYYPDLLCRFNEEHPLYDRWGGKLAIEVTYSHPCEEVKIHDFEFSNIPILEVVINKGSAREYPGERYNWDYYMLSSIEKHTNDLESWFTDYIGANLLVDPISTRAHKLIIKKVNLDHHEFKINSKIIHAKFISSENENLALIKKVDSFNLKMNKLIEINNYKIHELNVQSRHETKTLNDENKTIKIKYDTLYRNSLLNKNLIISLFVFCIALILSIVLSPLLFRNSAIQLINWYFELTS